MTAESKWIAALLIAVPAIAAATYYSLNGSTWECGLKMSIGDMHRDKNSLSMSNTIIETPGAYVINDQRMSVGSGFPSPKIQYGIYGDGNYRLKYSANVSKIVLWVGEKKAYDGPPVPEINAGPGWLGIDVYAEGKTYVEAMSRCSVGSFIRNVF
ncbi:hypothetical protein BH11PSE11_BH11PSE11_32240 [soil metagenome]